MRTIEEINAAMTALIDGAVDRSLTDDEVTQYEGFENELKAVQKSDAIRARNAAYNTVVNPAGAPRRGADATKDTYDTAFWAYVKSGGKANGDLQISNDQSEGVGSQGGYLVPDLFRQKLVERLKAFGGIASLAERYTTGNGNPVEWPTIDDTSNVGEIVQEGQTFSAGADLAFGTNSLGAYSYVAGGGGSTPLRLSLELVQDSAFDLQGLLTRLLATRIGRIQAIHWALGTGVAQPLGLLTGKTLVTSAANTGLTYEDLVTYQHSVDPAYRDGAVWAMNDLTFAAVRKIKNPTSGDYIYLGAGNENIRGPAGAMPGMLLDFPVVIDQAIPAYVNASPTTPAVVFGNINQGYVIRDVKDVQLLVNPYTRMANRQIEFTAWARADGTQQDTNAYMVGTGHA
jgi:HK97 family phage major capsid protein